jgi:hypothetical protein
LIIILIQAVVMAREMILLGEKFDARRRDVVADKDLMPTAITLDPETAKRVGAFRR